MIFRKRLCYYFKGYWEWGKWEVKGFFAREIGIVNFFFIKSFLKKLYIFLIGVGVLVMVLGI